MLLPNRHESTNEYRYGFQGQENDPEVKGIGNSVNYKYRMHDPRVGRFFAVYPLTTHYPGSSPYVFSQNRVIDGIELEGREWSQSTVVDEETGLTTITFNLKIKLVNSTGQPINQAQMKTQIVNEFQEQFTYKDVDNNIQYKAVMATTDIEFVEEADAHCDFYINIVEDSFKNPEEEETEDGMNFVGWTYDKDGQANTQGRRIDIAINEFYNGKLMGVENEKFENDEFVGFEWIFSDQGLNVLMHELGHSADLKHPWEYSTESPIYKSVVENEIQTFNALNLMWTGWMIEKTEKHNGKEFESKPGNELLPEQMEIIHNSITEDLKTE